MTYRTLMILLVGLSFTGCALGPEPTRPRSLADTTESFVNAPTDADDPAAPVGRWWEKFDDAPTNELVDQALAGNTDLRGAAARVMQARSLLGAAIGQRFPAVDANLSRDRSQRTFEFQGGRFSTINSTYTARLDVAWQVDLFGRLASAQQQRWLELLATEADQRALLHSVVAQVVRTRVQLATLQRQLAIARANTASFQSTYEVIDRRYERGVTTALDLRLAGENLAASRAREPQIEAQLRTTQHALDVLLGRQPGSSQPLADTIEQLPPLAPPPTGVPLALLDRRPDLQAAEFRAAAQQRGIGVALAELFPDITISAAVGYQGSTFEDLFDPQALIWSLITEAGVKLFQGGALRANVDASRAAAEALAADYATDVLVAMREVEDALVRDKLIREAHAQLTRRVAEAREAERLAQQRYERGVETILAVLETERRRRLAEEDQVLTERTLWETRVNLYLALGGDWAVPMPTIDNPQFIKKKPKPPIDARKRDRATADPAPVEDER